MSYIESIIVEEMENNERYVYELGGYSISHSEYKSVAQDIVSRIKERVEGLERTEVDAIDGEYQHEDGTWVKHSDILALFKEEGGSDEN